MIVGKLLSIRLAEGVMGQALIKVEFEGGWRGAAVVDQPIGPLQVSRALSSLASVTYNAADDDGE